MVNFQKIRTHPRVFQQLTGLTVAAFETLLADFERAYHDDRQQRDQQRPTPRQRRPGGGAKGTYPPRPTSWSSCCSLSGSTPPRRPWPSASASVKDKPASGSIV